MQLKLRLLHIFAGIYSGGNGTQKLVILRNIT
jgi:hypothetical protein